MYEELAKQLRESCRDCKLWDGHECCLDGDCTGRVRLQAADAIEELSKPRWIPVTERCPEKSGDYLVFDCCGNLYVNEWHCLLKRWQYDDSRITHWMPLPKPPKEET